MSSANQDIHTLLQQYWGYEAFRPLQEDIIQSVLAGQDTLALLPTGGGKSLCFQVPALAMEGLCLVVSPLIALMKDQVQNLQKRGIEAVAIYSGMNSRQIDITLDNCIFGSVKFLYLSPERLQTEMFQERLKRMKVGLLAIDEAHCISQWGYDFRPPYLQIGELREKLPGVQVIALTATATNLVKQDIQEKLLFKNGKVYQQSFARSNLSYSCVMTEDKPGKLLQVLQGVPGTTVVYVRSRKQTVELAKWLKGRRIPAAAYHAGLSFSERNAAQQAWLDGKTRVMVATNAFGMGIDKPDVRLVVHLDLPDTLEAYYQEAGRAGRDGKYAYATVLYNPADAEDLLRKVEEGHPAPEVLRKVYQALANYYQLAVGSGAFRSLDFHLDDFASTYKLRPLQVHHALHRLQQEGFIQLNEAFYSPSQVMIAVDHPTLYEYQIKNPEHDVLLKMLLRLYGGELYTNFLKISEKTLALNLNTTPEIIKKALSYLHKTGIILYEPQHDSPQLLFTTERYDAANLPLNKQKLEQFRKQALEKAKAVQEYVETLEQCRTKMLLAYFGEVYAQSCRICDYCLRQRKHQKPDPAQHQKQIKELLQKQALHPKDILAKFKTTEAEIVTEQLQQLLEHGILKYNEQGQLVLKEQ